MSTTVTGSFAYGAGLTDVNFTLLSSGGGVLLAASPAGVIDLGAGVYGVAPAFPVGFQNGYGRFSSATAGESPVTPINLPAPIASDGSSGTVSTSGGTSRSASDLIAQVRDHIQQPAGSVAPYCDGFAADMTANPTSTPILRWINKAMREMLETGISKCLFTLTLVPGQAEYGLVQAIHEITHATLNGVPLHQTTLLRRDSEVAGWQNYPSNVTVGAAPAPVRLGMPRYIYTYSDIVGFDPCPDQAYTVQILADDVPSDLALATDVPPRIPARYHDALASRAAWWISNMDIENTAAAARMPGLDADWGKAYQAVQRIAQDREWDADNQISAGDYRRDFRRGGY